MRGVYAHFQHSPVNVRPLENIQCLKETVMVITGKRFGEEVSDIISGGYLFERNCSGFDEFTNVVVTYVDMLHLSMVLSIFRQGDRPPTITSYNPWFLVFNFHFIQPHLHPNHLLCTTGHRDILSFNSRKCNRCLSLATPCNCSSSHSRFPIGKGRYF